MTNLVVANDGDISKDSFNETVLVNNNTTSKQTYQKIV